MRVCVLKVENDERSGTKSGKPKIKVNTEKVSQKQGPHEKKRCKTVPEFHDLKLTFRKGFKAEIGR
jgi:hypothetical protein